MCSPSLVLRKRKINILGCPNRRFQQLLGAKLNDIDRQLVLGLAPAQAALQALVERPESCVPSQSTYQECLQ